MSTTAPNQPGTVDRRILTGIMAGGMFSALGAGLFAFTIPLVSLDERISGAWLGSAFAAYYLAKLLVAPLSGLATDRFGPKPVLIFALCIGCFVPLLYFPAPELATLYAIQIVMGLVTGLVRPVGMAALGSSATGAALSQRFALHAAIFNGAAFIGPILGGLLYLNRAMEPVLAALAACMGLALLASALILPRTVSSTRSTSGTNEDAPAPRGKAAALLLAVGGRTLGIGLLTAFYPILLADTLGRQGPVMAAIYAVPGLTAFLGLALIGRFSTRRPDPLPAVTGMLTSALGLFLLGLCHSPWHFVATGVVMGLGTAISVPASMGLAATLTHRQGAIFGAANLASGIGLLLGPLLGGLMVQTTHALAPAMQTAALLGVLACLPMGTYILYERFHFGTSLASGMTGVAAIALLLILAVGLPLKSPTESTKENLYKFTDVAMGTIVNLTLEAGSRKAASDAARRTFQAMRVLQQDFDHRNPEGSIGRINRHAGQSWVKPTHRAYTLLKRALVISAESKGAFDPTIGTLTTSPLYFAMDEGIGRAKSDLVNYREVMIDPALHRIKLARQGMALDMGGIAKGTIVDDAVALLRKQGIRAGIVEAGGDFYCFGKRKWTVGIRHPRNPDSLRTISVQEKGVCGSGDYQQFITEEKNGETFMRHHIIDPATMESARESIGVTVVADTAETADALATTMFIMGPVNGTAFLDQYHPDAATIWYLPDGSIVTTTNFPK